MSKHSPRRTVSSVLVTAAVNYVMVLIVTVTAAVLMVQTVSTTITAKFLAIAAVLKKASL